MFRCAALVLALATATGCSVSRTPATEPLPPPSPRYGDDVADRLNGLLTDRYDETRAVDVLYATNRVAGSRPGCDDEAFGVDAAERMVFGVCRMNVPKRHPVGSLDAASDPRADPHAFFRALSHASLTPEAFEARLAQGRPDVLVFVHGFNVKFEEAVLRAAQIAYDLKFQGDVVLFTWPAGAPSGFLSGARIERTYEHNSRNAALTVPYVADFFRLLERLDQTAHVMVHSMGHQVVVPGLVTASTDSSRQFIGELVLNAPDYPVEAFREAAPVLGRLTHRMTVYCSYNDNAIAASEFINENRRMGACELVDGVDVINVGEIDAPALGVGGLGHGYYASRPILTDVFQVLMGIDAGRRLFVRRAEVNSTQNFHLRK